MPRRETDPYASYNFLFESNGLIQAAFSEVTGLNSETEVIEFRHGNDPAATPRKIAGRKKFGPVTLKCGVSSGKEILNWRKTVTDGLIERRDVSIVIFDEARNEVVRYNLAAAWPSKWIGPDLKANANEIAIETLEICHEGVTQA